MAKIFLLGATGFIGGYLRKALDEQGHDVVSLVRQKSEMKEYPFKTVMGDLTDYDRMLKVVKEVKPEVVYHLAAITPVRKSFEMPLLYDEINSKGTKNLIHACLEVLGNDFRFVGSSSAEVYGENGELVKREEQKLVPMSPYACSKASADMYTQMCGEAYGLQYVLLRCTNTFGRPHSGYFVESMMEKLIENKLCDLYNPYHFRDYMWYEDHVNAYLAVLDNGYGVYNVGLGNPITNIGMVRVMKKLIDSESEITVVAPPLNRPTDHQGINMDSSMIRNLGWKPLTGRNEAILKLWEMY